MMSRTPDKRPPIWRLSKGMFRPTDENDHQAKQQEIDAMNEFVHTIKRKCKLII